jgi:hypothetical protein
MSTDIFAALPASLLRFLANLFVSRGPGAPLSGAIRAQFSIVAGSMSRNLPACPEKRFDSCNA